MDDAADHAEAWRLTGPGIQHHATLNVAGLPDDFEHQWAVNHGVFPCGVDVLLGTPTHIVGLPRTTCISTHTAALHGAEV